MDPFAREEGWCGRRTWVYRRGAEEREATLERGLLRIGARSAVRGGAAAVKAELAAVEADGWELVSYTVQRAGGSTKRRRIVVPAEPAGGGGPGLCSFHAYREFRRGTSSKFWDVAVQGSEVHTTYGRIGTRGATTVRDFGTPAEAVAAAREKLAEKERKGYRVAATRSPAAPDKPPTLEEELAPASDSEAEEEAPGTGKLGFVARDAVLCLTGRLTGMTRAEATKRIRKAGWGVSSSMSKAVTHLVDADGRASTAKRRQAEERGIPVWTEATLLAQLERAGV